MAKDSQQRAQGDVVAKSFLRPAKLSLLTDRLLFFGCGAAVALFLYFALYSSLTPIPFPDSNPSPPLTSHLSTQPQSPLPNHPSTISHLSTQQNQSPSIPTNVSTIQNQTSSSYDDDHPRIVSSKSETIPLAKSSSRSSSRRRTSSSKRRRDPRKPPSDPPPPSDVPQNSSTFYDDPDLSYTLDRPISDWDAKRRQWLRLHPWFSATPDRILMVTGSKPGRCSNPTGDHLLLRFYKNKADYCRIHGFDLFYNMALLHPSMPGCWAKLPLVRAAMVAHPEAEWIWWIDEDAAFTDIEFRPPFDRYSAYNLVIPGYPSMVYEQRNWIGLNAGVFLIRNSQWGLDFLDSWARLGPQTPNYRKWTKILLSEISGKDSGDSDDQSALVHLLVKDTKRWGNKVYLENSYDLHGYWEAIMGRLDNITERYKKLEKKEKELRRRHAEKDTVAFGETRLRHLDHEVGVGPQEKKKRRPFVTHFTGCQPCGGGYNPTYTWESCYEGMHRALNFADDQVLRAYGFGRPDINDISSVQQLPFDYPASPPG
ncbi:galactomannan galactosyltransferase 1 [Elaeis guineensis]|uniref:Galactomannan galactosyltransferase 1 n=1 Tax=Elaeis guineensis var. tenera TaxID=51953 RepID=A0A6I9SHJ4_ELAGV|nr:galactomannan galactosyltransferase 1 [Elaeis guineensis]